MINYRKNPNKTLSLALFLLLRSEAEIVKSDHHHHLIGFQKHTHQFIAVNPITQGILIVSNITLFLGACANYYYYRSTMRVEGAEWKWDKRSLFCGIFHIHILYTLWNAIDGLRNLDKTFLPTNENLTKNFLLSGILPTFYLLFFLYFFYDLEQQPEIYNSNNEILQKVEVALREASIKKTEESYSVFYIAFGIHIIIFINNFIKWQTGNYCNTLYNFNQKNKNIRISLETTNTLSPEYF